MQAVLASTLALISLVVFATLIAQMRPDASYTHTTATSTATEKMSTPEEMIAEEAPETFESVQKDIIVPKEAISVPLITPEEPVEETTQITQPQTEPVVVPSVPFYTTPPISLDIVNTATLPAVVNILCGSNQGSAIPGATGSGIIIDPRGIILTNAHVAQYLLLKEHPEVRISCIIRTGAPAKAKYTADIVEFPSKWAEKHAKDILAEQATGTGEHDWALLYITGMTDGSTKQTTFPFVSYDVRQGVTQTNDQVLLAGYPAGFLGNIALKKELWPVSTVISIQKVYTFSRSIIDLLALGGNIVAQGGSSGGAVINQWNKLVGIISTSSLGETTDERDLRAVTLSHIDASVTEQTGTPLESFLLQGDFENRVGTFNENISPYLLELYPL